MTSARRVSLVESGKPRDEAPIQAQRRPEAVFVVHGRKHDVRDRIVSYLSEDLGLETHVMEAGPHLGRTLPEKFEEMAAICSFAVLIATADDILQDPESGAIVKRARQNVILETGYFWGVLGRRSRLALLVEADPDLEMPTDLDGLGWIPITPDLAETKEKLRAELVAAGLAA